MVVTSKNKSEIWLDAEGESPEIPPDLVVKQISEADGLAAWKAHLWPGREKIRAVSSMTWNHETKEAGIDTSLYARVQAKFFALCDRQNEIVAVAAGHPVDSTYYRTRGIWVSENYRGLGLITSVLWAVLRDAADQGSSIVWTLPRKQALNAYERAGFRQDSEFFDEGVLYGPNCYAICKLDTQMIARIRGEIVD